MHDLLQQFSEEIRDTHRGWAKATGALASIRDYAAAATWAADWEERKPDEPWMLHPLAIALRQLGRWKEAHKVIVYALDLPAEDTTTDDFRVWLAFEEAIEGRPDRADRLLDVVDAEELDDVPRVLHAMTKSLIEVQRGGRVQFDSAREQGLRAIREFAPKDNDADLTLSYQRWARRLARDAGGMSPWMWSVLHGRKLPRSG